MTTINPTRPLSVRDLDDIRQGGMKGAQDAAQNLVEEMNDAGIMDAHGKKMTFDTLEEWQAFLKSPGPKFISQPPAGPQQLNTEKMNEFMGNITSAQNNITAAARRVSSGEAGEVAEMLEAMKKLLESGDILAAITLLGVTQVKVLDQQLSGRIMALQERNATVKTLNDDLAALQKGAGSPPTGAQQEAMTKKKGEIDKMNADSQLDMISIQSLTTKRNQAFEMLSNLTSKLQSASGTIIGNMR